ncbi:hypothetical protein OH76DRAFT_1410204 [Lentinus brumalis]|uniref:Uncharacterized protein n=1 Tax=Lentinus brumalis TaxID=2498619 RepID=A0A371CT04_9APHY|nr:hypothetical protein OH76DRAFT_1410204 [Polyporus brumalis]
MYEIAQGLNLPASASDANRGSEKMVPQLFVSPRRTIQLSSSESISDEPMFIEAELFDSMRSVQSFWEDPMMIDLLDRFLFWHQHMRPFYDNTQWNPQFISECLCVAAKRIMEKYPDRDIAILPHFELGGPDGHQSPAATEPSITNGERMGIPTISQVRYAVLHYPNDRRLGLQVAIIQSKNGAMKAMKKRNDISCCIIIEAAEGRKHGVFSFRPDAIAAALALMSHTSLAEVRTCVTDGEDWMFGRLVMRDGRRVYMDLEPVSVCTVPRFTPPIDSMRGRLSLVTKMLACWIDGVAPFIGQELGEEASDHSS